MQKKELITEQGYFTFVKEFKNLLEKEKPYWVKEKEIAAQLGDRSENAEYISAKEQIRNIDKRLRFLDKIIKTAQVINTYEIPHIKVNFGSIVELLDINSDEVKSFIIVGTYETKPSENKISNKSPLGKTLLGKEQGAEFEFRINDNIFEYEVLSIKKYIFKKAE
ncbi:GreA/GreB family elongation factor [Poseidonibacter lekithochrous]|uniref:GreA/GreB family elongation factor n=1 Tax=Poseidonibacter lekithochrous TaxID=1904463 RepID=UPI0008FC80FD|nr:GreA/GreB family elongation factor [Poseidonibacter lekithochrous]QKJ23476.1 transcription elongation factor GreB [Poseidonibacter lekithochrous]